MGFTFPFDQIFREALDQELSAFFMETGSEVLDGASLRKIWTAYKKGSVSWSRIWALFILGHWVEKHSAHSGPAASAGARPS